MRHGHISCKSNGGISSHSYQHKIRWSIQGILHSVPSILGAPLLEITEALAGCFWKEVSSDKFEINSGNPSTTQRWCVLFSIHKIMGTKMCWFYHFTINFFKMTFIRFLNILWIIICRTWNPSITDSCKSKTPTWIRWSIKYSRPPCLRVYISTIWGWFAMFFDRMALLLVFDSVPFLGSNGQALSRLDRLGLDDCPCDRTIFLECKTWSPKASGSVSPCLKDPR